MVNLSELQQAINAAVTAERRRCSDIVQGARQGDLDNDLRSIISMIEGGLTVAEIKDL